MSYRHSNRSTSLKRSDWKFRPKLIFFPLFFQLKGGSHLSYGVRFDPETNLPVKGHLERVELIKSAIRQGVNYIDIAPLYGSGRCEVIAGLVWVFSGEQFKKLFWMAAFSVRNWVCHAQAWSNQTIRFNQNLICSQALKDIPREQFFIATKVGRNHDCEFDYSRDGVRKSFEKSLKNLQINYVDVIHIHDVEFADPGRLLKWIPIVNSVEPIECLKLIFFSSEVLLNETLPALDQLRRTKQARHLGITGYDLKLLKWVDLFLSQYDYSLWLSTSLPSTSSNQNRSIVKRSSIRIDFVQSYCKYVLFNDELLDYLPFFREQNISVINSAPLAMSLLTNSSQIPAWHPADERVKRICLDAGSFCKVRPVFRSFALIW